MSVVAKPARVAFRPERVIIPPSADGVPATDWVINDIQIGGNMRLGRWDRGIPATDMCAHYGADLDRGLHRARACRDRATRARQRRAATLANLGLATWEWEPIDA